MGVQNRYPDPRSQARAANGRKHRRKRKRNYTLYYILMAFFVLATGITLSMTVFFNITEIAVTGARTLSPEEIAAAAEVEPGDNLFRLHTEKMEQKILDTYIYVDHAKIYRELPDTLVIEIEEASPYFNLHYGDLYSYISRNGRVLETGRIAPYEGIMVVEGLPFEDYEPGDFLGDSYTEQLELYREITDAMETYGLEGVTAINLQSPLNITFSYADRLTVDLGDRKDLEYKIKGMAELIHEHIPENATGELLYIASSNSFHYIPQQDEPEPADPSDSSDVSVEESSAE
ncbi:MAG TPA: FtsQ-type POTRA domain-containing protein [Firmicutes bacterium]|nr:FtsQ-type POTRA domain-containing protein [Bacillota bacterium]